MKKQIGIFLLAIIAAVGFSGAVTAQSTYSNNGPSFNYGSGHGWHVAWEHTWEWSANPTRHSYRVIKENMPQYRQTTVTVLKRSHDTNKWYVAWEHTWKWGTNPTRHSYRAIMLNMPQYRQTTVTVLKKGHHSWLSAATIS